MACGPLRCCDAALLLTLALSVGALCFVHYVPAPSGRGQSPTRHDGVPRAAGAGSGCGQGRQLPGSKGTRHCGADCRQACSLGGVQRVKAALEAVAPQFKGSAQHDSQEALVRAPVCLCVTTLTPSSPGLSLGCSPRGAEGVGRRRAAVACHPTLPGAARAACANHLPLMYAISGLCDRACWRPACSVRSAVTLRGWRSRSRSCPCPSRCWRWRPLSVTVACRCTLLRRTPFHTRHLSQRVDLMSTDMHRLCAVAVLVDHKSHNLCCPVMPANQQRRREL